jgi:hypothetical protein
VIVGGAEGARGYSLSANREVPSRIVSCDSTERAVRSEFNDESSCNSRPPGSKLARRKGQRGAAPLRDTPGARSDFGPKSYAPLRSK